MRFTRILTGVDGSRAAMSAAVVAIDLAREHAGDLRAVYVVQSGGPGALIAALRASGSNVLAEVCRMARRGGVEAQECLLEGVPFEEILAEARRWGADLIVMGRTGQTGPGKALLGSETERVVEFADIPVLIVPSGAAL